MYHTTLWDPYEELKLEVSSEHNMTFEKTYIILRLWAIHIIINFNQDFSSRFLSCVKIMFGAKTDVANKKR